jgi:hypothetical protein
MKTGKSYENEVRMAVLTVGLLGLVACAEAGDLNPPPGVIQPTNRVQLNPQAITLPYTIWSPGSYVLTGNITGAAGQPGIVVAADNVTVDLNGFVLQGVPGSLDGIRPSGMHENLTVLNGMVVDWGGAGVSTYVFNYPYGDTVLYSRLEGLIVSGNGGFGIRAALGSVVRNCIAHDNGDHGIVLTNYGGVAENCVADNNTGSGFCCADGSTLVHCSAHGNDGAGVALANSGHTIIGGTMTYNGNGGIVDAHGSVIRDCAIMNNSVLGLRIAAACLITGNEINNNGGPGIAGVNVSPLGRSRIEGNNICANGSYGIDLANNPGNFIYRNTLRSNLTADLNLGTGNSAPTSNNPATAGPWHNIVLTP